MVNNSRQLSVSDSITVDDNAVRKLLVDLVVLAKSIAHPDFQVVCKLLSCGLEHHLAVVPVGRGAGRKREGRRERGGEGRGGGREGEGGREREGRREGGKEGGREGGREGRREGGKGEREGDRKVLSHQTLYTKSVGSVLTLKHPTLSWWGWCWR